MKYLKYIWLVIPVLILLSYFVPRSSGLKMVEKFADIPLAGKYLSALPDPEDGISYVDRRMMRFHFIDFSAKVSLSLAKFEDDEWDINHYYIDRLVSDQHHQGIRDIAENLGVHVGKDDKFFSVIVNWGMVSLFYCPSTNQLIGRYEVKL